MAQIAQEYRFSFIDSFTAYNLVGLVVKASASRVVDPGFASCLRQDFSRLSHASDLKIGTPARHLLVYGQCWDWLAWCQYAVTG